jgi:hypothetical protein
MEILESSRDVAWQPSQNQAFLIIAGAMILGGVLVLLL